MSTDRSRIEEVERSMAETRHRMAATAAELDEKVSSRVSAAKEAVDLRRLVAEHPWPAVLLAVAAGILLARSGADARAVEAARRTPELAKEGAARAAGAVREKLRHRRERKDEAHRATADEAAHHRPAGMSGLAWRVATAVKGDELLESMRSEADRIASPTPPPGPASTEWRQM